MKLIQAGRLWQLEPKISIEENVRMAVKYFGDKYGEKFEFVAMRPADREAVEGKTCSGVKIVQDDEVTPGCIFLARAE